MRIVLVLMLAACTSAADPPIGAALWHLDVAPSLSSGQIGPGGHLGRAIGNVELVSPEGKLAWGFDCEDRCTGRAAVDADGNVTVAAARGTMQELVRLAASDGSVAWMRAIKAPVSFVAQGADDTIWWFAGVNGSIDFGGGPITPSRGDAFGRFTADAAFLASGSIESHIDVDRPILALPGGGFAAVESQTGAIFAFDATGRTQWRVERKTIAFALHEDGELTLLERVDDLGLYDIVRLDTARDERWRSAGPGWGSDLTPLTGGRALVIAVDGGVSPPTAHGGLIQLVDAAGVAQIERTSRFVDIFHGPPLDSYRLHTFTHGGQGRIVARSAP